MGQLLEGWFKVGGIPDKKNMCSRDTSSSLFNDVEVVTNIKPSFSSQLFFVEQL
jgi:hypothetical protein